jgi:hypothetical protein
MASIRTLVQACCDEFEAIRDNAVVTESSLDSNEDVTLPLLAGINSIGLTAKASKISFTVLLNNEIGRFKIWTSNTGALAKSQSITLDDRLRDVPDVASTLQDILDSLHERLLQLRDEVIEIYSGRLNSSLKDSASERSALAGHAQRRLQSVSDTIGRLSRLSNSIFKASSSARDARAAQYTWRDENGDDCEALWKQNFALQFCERKFGKASPQVIERLASGMVLRRKLLLYRTHRIAKLAETSVARPKLIEPSPADRLPKSAITSVPTAATPIDPSTLRRQRTASIISSAQSLGLDSDIKAKYPPRPQFSNSSAAICQFCGQLLSANEIKNDSDWR